MLTWRRTLRLLCLMVFGLAVAADVTAHECAVYHVHAPQNLQKGKTLTVGLFDLRVPEGTQMAKAAALQTFAAERFTKELEKWRYFAAVRIATGPDVRRGDYHVEGAVSELDPGSRWMRAVLGSGGARTRVRGVIRLASGDVLLDFECEAKETGGVFAAGGLLAAFDSVESVMRKNFEKFAVDFAATLKEVDKQWTDHSKKGPRKRQISEGDTKAAAKPWRQRPPAEWTPANHSKEAATYIVETQNRNWFRTHGMWLTASAYESNRFLNAFDFKGIEPDLADALLPDLSALDQWDRRTQYLVAVTFESGATDGSTDGDEPPFFWSDDEARAATTLTRSGAPESKVVAARVIRLRPYLQRRGTFGVRWRNVPMVFAFDTVDAAGRPLVTSASDVIELHTTLPGYEARVRFRLADFELPNLEALLAAAPVPPR